MKRVVFLNPVAVLGGGERSLVTLLEALKHGAPDWQPHVILGAHGPLEDKIAELDVPCEVIALPESFQRLGDSVLQGHGKLAALVGGFAQSPRTAWELCRAIQALRIRLRALAPDIVHTNGLKAHLLGAITRPHRSQLVWHIRDFIGERRMARWALRALASQASLILTNSQAVGLDMAKLLPRHAISTLYNAVDTAYFCPGVGSGVRLDELATMKGAHAGTIRIGLVAAYARWKGHDVFLQAVREIRRRAPGLSLRFYIIGGPIYQTRGSQFSLGELRQLAAELGVTEDVGFIPFQSDLPPIYRSLDIVVHASTRPEPFGLAIVEAMACGRPVVASLQGGAGELFLSEEDALGVASMTPMNLAHSILRLINDANLRRRLGNAARECAMRRFSAQRLQIELPRIYEEIRRTAPSQN